MTLGFEAINIRLKLKQQLLDAATRWLDRAKGSSETMSDLFRTLDRSCSCSTTTTASLRYILMLMQSYNAEIDWKVLSAPALQKCIQATRKGYKTRSWVNSRLDLSRCCDCPSSTPGSGQAYFLQVCSVDVIIHMYNHTIISCFIYAGSQFSPYDHSSLYSLSQYTQNVTKHLSCAHVCSCNN